MGFVRQWLIRIVLVQLVSPAAGHFRPLRHQRIVQVLNVVRRHGVVRINERAVFAAHVAQALIPRRRHTAVFLAEDTEAAIRVLLDDLHAVISRAVIHEKEFEIRVCLRRQAGNAPGQLA